MADSITTKKTLAVALKKLLSEQSFAKISIGEICSECGKSSEYWSFDDGFLCGNCASELFSVIHPVSPAVQKAIKHILTTDGKGAYSFKMSEKAFGELSTLSEKYLEAKTEMRFRSLDFYSKLGSEE